MSALLNLPQLPFALEEIKNISPVSWKGAGGSCMFVAEHSRVPLVGMKDIGARWSTKWGVCTHTRQLRRVIELSEGNVRKSKHIKIIFFNL